MTASTEDVTDKPIPFTQRKSVFAASGGLVAVILIMAATNPGKPAYVNYASERLHKELKQDCSELKDDIELGSILKLPTGDLCKSFVGSVDAVGRGAVKLVINTATDRKNFGVFSLYTTELPGRTFKTIGIGRNFITFYQS
ncbi:DUF4359 domain-containing protein [Oscillatoria sp. CS-180]|uniref:DUF4359 domain-containing protein n=1 Tax=Oscillatoria sp. CS-180 TaxID=3021720 RepID=UPI00232ED082|nr:DUF4359 domain-containing protein [Oscillatoria sp. CS-180]MDB9527649.1 DUF4359 domain-containing protein [Oscillatoria sp. CS-180]